MQRIEFKQSISTVKSKFKIISNLFRCYIILVNSLFLNKIYLFIELFNILFWLK
jgi:hypothetical protein